MLVTNKAVDSGKIKNQRPTPQKEGCKGVGFVVVVVFNTKQRGKGTGCFLPSSVSGMLCMKGPSVQHTVYLKHNLFQVYSEIHFGFRG